MACDKDKDRLKMDEELDALWSDGISPEKRAQALSTLQEIASEEPPHALGQRLKNPARLTELEAHERWSMLRITSFAAPALALLLLVFIAPWESNSGVQTANEQTIHEEDAELYAFLVEEDYGFDTVDLNLFENDLGELEDLL